MGLIAPHRWQTPVAIVSMLLLAGMAVHVHRGGGFVFDASILMAMRAWQSPSTDAVFVPITVLGYAGGVIPVSIALVCVLLLRGQWRLAVFAGVAMAGTGLLNQAIKHAVARARPDVGPVPLLEHTYSFPSAHAMGATALACVLIALAWPSRWRWPVAGVSLLFAVLVGVSRVYLGVHHPSDVLAGWLAGASWVIMVAAVVLPNSPGDAHEQR